MKKPSLRVTKWLGDIPVTGECTSCAGVRFDAKSNSHRPTRQEYQQSLQRQFDAHLKQVHSLQETRQSSSLKVDETPKDK